MPAIRRRRRAAILGSAFIAATLAFGPFAVQASAAPQSGTHIGTSAKAPQSAKDYQRGFKDGFKSGFRQGQRNCDHHDHDDHKLPADLSSFKTDVHHVKKVSGNDYQRGFKDGFKSGFRQGQRSC